MLQKLKRVVGRNRAFNMVVGKHNNQKLLKWLSIEYGELIKRYKNVIQTETPESNLSDYLWVCWWQGENAMTPLVKKCYEKICELNSDKKIVLITEYNLNEWVYFPEYIIDKFNKGIITKTHMSDLLRCELLKNYGGIWMDITIYPSAAVPNQCFDYPVYSCKMKPGKWAFSVSENKWTSFFWVSRYTNNILFCFLSDFWYMYWKNNNSLIEYFLIDFVIALGYENIPAIKNELDALELNGCGTDCWQLLNEIRVNSLFDEKRLEDIQNDGWFQKLSYKGESAWVKSEGDTFYKHMFM